MSTIIYPSPIFGPVHSRRLGVSLGVNLMPGDGKVCSFDCIYCECGFNSDFRPKQKRPTREEVKEALTQVLKQRHEDGEPLDVITFAGNGEPTGHPDFAGIIDDTIKVRNQYFPEAKVSVLSNATYIQKEDIHEALMRVDNNIQKLDTIDPLYINKVDRPQQTTYDVRKVVEYLKAFRGHVIIQTMFMRGDYKGETVDNTSEAYVAPWLKAVMEIQPQQVMIYTIDRETPAQGLLKATPEWLDALKERIESIGIKCSASY
ncbi:MAG: radical SAM protein [Prevotella sp.]|nr:radical SAM protein [Prevotella sp.]